MKTIIKSLLLLSVVLLLTAPVLFAQKRAKNQKQQPSLVERLEQLKTDLVLTDDQIEKVKPLLEANRERNTSSRDQLRSELKSDRQNRRAMMGEMRKATAESQKKLNASLKEILTNEQFEKLQTIQKKHREEMMNKNRPNRN
jgi:Spy/CpxP family protein refolding chaperone